MNANPMLRLGTLVGFGLFTLAGWGVRTPRAPSRS